MTTRKHARVRMLVAGVALLVASWAIAWGVWQGRLGRPSGPSYADLLREPPVSPVMDDAVESRIRAFCGDCHAVPRPESFHRDAWHDEVEKGYRLYAQSGRTDLHPPPIEQTVAFFRSRAPEKISYPEPKEADAPFRTSFEPERFDLEPGDRASPAIAGLCWASLGGKEPPLLFASDMASGQVTAADPGNRRARPRLLAQLNNPCHMAPCDLDGDGAVDLLVADLGSYSARDHDRGRVVWLRQDRHTGRFEEIVLASGLGRVADVRPIDTDSSGKLDLVVAEFGWYRTGKILWLQNTGSRDGPPRFEAHEVDPRSGTIHVPVCDLNRDGRPDFLALVSNESECVEAFLGQGGGKFHRRTLWQAPDLTFGSSGIELVDLDGDGDEDVLYVNGDAFDNMYVSPWHGLQWLENLGAMQFKVHRLTDMPGAGVALAGDFDGDGDSDILVVAFLPRGLKPDAIAEMEIPSIVLLEQTRRGCFVRHTIERGFPCHAAAVVGDFNHDGRLDFAVGNHAAGHRADMQGHTWLTVWWNRGGGSQEKK